MKLTAFVDSVRRVCRLMTCVAFAAFPLLWSPAPVWASTAALALAKEGKPLCRIVLADDAIPAERTAAEQLQKYLQEVTGAAFPISSDADADKGAEAGEILVGAGKRARQLLPNEDWEALGKDGIVMKTVGKSLVLAGGRPRGTLYAVFQFLEDEVGCRWWTPTESSIPKKENLEIKALDRRYIPIFDYREHFTTATRENEFFSAVLKENGKHQPLSAEWGGHYDILGFVHTFSKLLPPKKYFEDHPEWYTDPTRGCLPATKDSPMPKDQHTQLCLSNPEVLEELTRKALAWIDANPEAGYISISQNDGGNYCRCPSCSSLAEKEGSPSANMLKFVNAVAEKIHEKYPGFQVETLAYTYTEKPPKTIRPGKDVLIRLAPIFMDCGHPLDSDWNRKYRENLLKWKAIAPKLFIWNYTTNFRRTLFIHPNWNGLADDLRFYAANNVCGVFSQGDCYTGGAGDFTPLRTWLMGKLLWNPQLDQNALMDEFLSGYYGAAGPWLRQYIDLIEKAFLAQQRGLNTYNEDFSFLTLDVANEAIRLFGKAMETVKDDATLSNRVRRERLSLDVTMIYRDRFLRAEAERTGQRYSGASSFQQAVEELSANAKKFEIRRWNPGKAFDEGFAAMLKVFDTPEVPLPDFLRKSSRADVIDFQPAMMKLYNSTGQISIQEDEAASGGTSVVHQAKTQSWDIQAFPAPHLEFPNEKWRVYVVARVDTAPGTPLSQKAFQGGIFDESGMKEIARFSVPLQKVHGSAYHTVDLGTHSLAGDVCLVRPTEQAYHRSDPYRSDLARSRGREGEG